MKVRGPSFLFGILCLLPVLDGYAVTRYVVPPGTPGVTPTSPYTNWATASTNLSILRYGMSAGDTLIVSNGTYCLTNQINPLCAGALIQGLTTNPDDVVITTDAAYVGRLFWLDGGGSWGERTTWVGLTFSNGYSVNLYGAAMELYNCTNVTYRNCVFAGNKGLCSGAAVNGSYNADGLRLLDCVFRNNMSTGANSRGGAVIASGVVISNCLFSGNYADGPNGGAIQISSSASITSFVYNCVFTNNSVTNVTTYGGAGYNSSPLRIYDCTFVANTSAYLAGGWYIGHSNTVMANCRFLNNRTTRVGDGGGGGLIIAADAVVTNCAFAGNYGSTGGGAYFYVSHGGLLADCVLSNNTAAQGAGVGFYHESAGEVRNCLITSNAAVNSAGGLYVRSVLSPPFPAGTSIYTNRVVSCTVTRNFAPKGGGIELMCPPYAIMNSIIYSNMATDTARIDLYNDGTYAYAATGAYSYCCTPSNFPTGNNITNDPRFVDHPNGNYRLAPRSRCVNAGTNQVWMLTAADLDRRPRIQSSLVDIGCYEYVFPGTMLLLR
jgi:hypothetical protein